MNREPRRQRTYFVLLMVTAFALLTIDYHSNGSSSPLHPLEKLVAGVVGPGENAVSSLTRPLSDEIHFGKQPDKVAELQKQLDEAKSLAETSQNDHRIVAQLDALLGWPPYYAQRMKPARVVSSGDTLTDDGTITIDIGTHDGVHVEMTVVSGLGLIGNVVRADSRTSTVRLLTDPGLHVGVNNGRTNAKGLVSGAENGLLSLTQFSQTSDIHVGDQLVTKGSKDNQPYVPDVPVGVVTSVNNTPGAATHGAVVRPWANFNDLDLVAVIFPPKPLALPRGFLIRLPAMGPAPTSTPTPTSTSSSPLTSGTPTSGGSPKPGKSGTTSGATGSSSPPVTPKP